MQSCRSLGKLVLQDHKADAEYFKKPLENYAEMAIIFENSMTTRNYAKDSSSALGYEDVEHGPESNVNAVPRTPNENGASSSATRSNKRSRTNENKDNDPLVRAIDRGSERIASAIEKLVEKAILPSDLIVKVQELLGFDNTHKSYYYSHLLENPHIAIAFYDAPFDYKLNFMAKWISEKFPE